LVNDPIKCLHCLQLSGGDWRPELLFEVPREHEEMQRLDQRYKK
jgi:hypothetical protein